MYICAEDISDVTCCNAFLGINLNDLDAPTSVRATRTKLQPEWDYPIEHYPHYQKCGNFDFSKVPTWASYWANEAKTKMIAAFGATRPNPGTAPTLMTRCGYEPTHHGYWIQRSVYSGNPLVWYIFNQTSGEPLNHVTGNDDIDQIYGGSGIDIPRSQQPYTCVTVIGIHDAPAGSGFSKYDYNKLGHYKLTGSVTFDQRGCEGNPCGDPSHEEDPDLEQPDDMPCSMTYELIPNGRERPAQYSDNAPYGYGTAPENAQYITGAQGAVVDNQQITNWYLCSMLKCFLSVDSLLWQLLNEHRRLRNDITDNLSDVADAISGMNINIDSTPIVNSIDQLRQLHDSVFIVRPPG